MRILKNANYRLISAIENMKMELLVIADQNAAVNMFSSFEQTARHAEKGFFVCKGFINT